MDPSWFDDINIPSTNQGKSMREDRSFIEQQELQLFELMEELSGHASFCSTSSVIGRFIKTDLNLNIPPGISIESQADAQFINDTDMRNNNRLVPRSSPPKPLEVPAPSPLNPEVMHRVMQLIQRDSTECADYFEPSQKVQSTLLKARIMELETEIVDFKLAKERLDDLQSIWKEKVQELEKEKEEFLDTRKREFRFLLEEKAELVHKQEMLEEAKAEHVKYLDECMIKEEKLEEYDNLKKLAEASLEKTTQVHLATEQRLKDIIRELEKENEELRFALKYKSKLSKNDASVQTTFSTLGEWNNEFSSQMPVATDYECEQGWDNVATHSKSRKRIPSPSDDLIVVAEQQADSQDDRKFYENGTREIFSRVGWVRTLFGNGDIQEKRRDGVTKYYYCEMETWQTTYPNGLDVYEFPNGQIEHRKPGGAVEIQYPNGCSKHIYPSGIQECQFQDNTVLRIEPNGNKILQMKNGQKELHTANYRKRIYPDGTIKVVYFDGSQETVYSNGRIRTKNPNGHLVYDGLNPKSEKESNTITVN